MSPPGIHFRKKTHKFFHCPTSTIIHTKLCTLLQSRALYCKVLIWDILSGKWQEEDHLISFKSKTRKILRRSAKLWDDQTIFEATRQNLRRPDFETTKLWDDQTLIRPDRLWDDQRDIGTTRHTTTRHTTTRQTIIYDIWYKLWIKLVRDRVIRDSLLCTCFHKNKFYNGLSSLWVVLILGPSSARNQIASANLIVAIG